MSDKGTRLDGESDKDEELVFEDDTLTWGVVARVYGVGESRKQTRATTSRVRSKNSTSNTLHLINEEEEDIEGFKSVDEDDEDIDLLVVDVEVHHFTISPDVLGYLRSHLTLRGGSLGAWRWRSHALTSFQGFPSTSSSHLGELPQGGLVVKRLRSYLVRRRPSSLTEVGWEQILLMGLPEGGCSNWRTAICLLACSKVRATAGFKVGGSNMATSLRVTRRTIVVERHDVGVVEWSSLGRLKVTIGHLVYQLGARLSTTANNFRKRATWLCGRLVDFCSEVVSGISGVPEGSATEGHHLDQGWVPPRERVPKAQQQLITSWKVTSACGSPIPSNPQAVQRWVGNDLTMSATSTPLGCFLLEIGQDEGTPPEEGVTQRGYQSASLHEVLHMETQAPAQSQCLRVFKSAEGAREYLPCRGSSRALRALRVLKSTSGHCGPRSRSPI
ncbi:hypothetical protein Acr_00g0098260 [Actinidia rufa]|uniref:Uncharacterized protein n=1 Tax=Actinidia rufa TaxID=165716 RepID=A0A7J0DZA3_9ERIC|nr:hypothetical protein Acr_00g0098260 [Actinidia rufa]